MSYTEQVGSARQVRRWRSIAEKRHIVQLTMEPEASVAEVARSHGLNANQVFKWRRAFEKGELVESYAALLPVSISSASEPESAVVDQADKKTTAEAGTIHIELPGRARISVESGADEILLRCILESLCR